MDVIVQKNLATGKNERFCKILYFVNYLLTISRLYGFKAQTNTLLKAFERVLTSLKYGITEDLLQQGGKEKKAR